MVVAAQSLLDRPDAVLTLSVIGLSALVLLALLVHALLRHRGSRRWSPPEPPTTAYDALPMLPAQRVVPAVPEPAQVPAQQPETVDLTLTEIDLTITEIDRAIADMEQRFGAPGRRAAASDTGWPV